MQTLASLERIIKPSLSPERSDGLQNCASVESNGGEESISSLEFWLQKVSVRIHHVPCICVTQLTRVLNDCLAGLCPKCFLFAVGVSV